ncbi:hypothetical protein BSKO_13135 [Bryopsis sp. KO-2023]|nr:hypothetical protein BSKO_13135 [Bryopsis sp. KO-2023]
MTLDELSAAPHSQGEARQSDEDTEQWDFLLRFRDPELESRYLAGANGGWMAIDGLMSKMVTVFGVARIFAWQSSGLVKTATHHSWYALLCFVIHPLLLLGRNKKPTAYLSNRIHTQVIHRLLIGVGMGIITCLDDTLMIWGTGNMLARMLTRTPISSLMSFSIGFRLPFRHHIVVQGIAAAISWLWVVKFCEACELDGEVDASVNRIGWATEGLMQRIAALGYPIEQAPLQDGEYSCWLVGFFYHFWVAYFVPSIVVYGMECSSRSAFLIPMLRETDSRRFSLATRGRLTLLGLILVAGTQVLWFISNSLFGNGGLFGTDCG